MRLIEILIHNIIYEAREFDGKVVSYKIRPADGYKLHEKNLDEPVFDENGNETNKIKLGYTTRFTTVDANYDWEKNERKIYAIPIDAEDEIIEKELEEDEETSELLEKAKAYDILTGADTNESY